MAIVGIDLGTTNSLISVFTDDGPVLIPNQAGAFMTPSADLGNGQYEHGHFQPIIERNTVIPVSRVIRNSTLHPDQKEISLGIYQGESPRIADNIFLGEMKIKLPPSKTKGEHQEFDIRFTYDVSGVLEILVTTLSDDQTKRMVIEGNPGSLSKGGLITLQ